MNEKLIIVRGGGDLATGVIQKLHHCGFKVLVLETNRPTAIRRKVSFSEAIYQGQILVENDLCVKIHGHDQAESIWRQGAIPIMVDPQGELITILEPWAVIDAIIAKKNLGTRLDMAPRVIGFGPGFTAGVDVHIVIETNRGHNLGRLIFEGQAAPNTGTPGMIKGISKERVIYAPVSGKLEVKSHIGDLVKKDDVIALIDGKIEVLASIEGVIRGMLPNDFEVWQGLKMADIDPRLSERDNCFTVSDKARALGGAALEALMIKLP